MREGPAETPTRITPPATLASGRLHVVATDARVEPSLAETHGATGQEAVAPAKEEICPDVSRPNLPIASHISSVGAFEGTLKHLARL